MLDIRFVRENPDAVKENIKKKFQDSKLPLVDEVIRLDAEKRATQQEVESLKAARNKLSKANGPLFGQLKKCEDEAKKAELQAQIDANNAAVKADADRMAELDKRQAELEDKIRDIMYTIPQMIDPSVPIGPDDSANVEVERFGEPVVPDYEIPHHVDIMQSFNGIDKESAGEVAGMGFYYLLGDIARLHEAVLAYARDFMIDEKKFTYVIPPFMMHGNVVKGVMSFPEMEAMMYKIEGEDLYLIGTSEHTMIGRFIGKTLSEADMPLTLTSYSPCFRKEVGSHGLEERGVYRIHQFEKQEMIVVCKPEESMEWYDRLWKNSVELFRNLEIPVRQLECCSGRSEGEELRYRGMEPPPEKVLRGLLLLQPGRCTGTPPGHSHQGRGRQNLSGPHPQQHLRGTPAYADRLPGKPPAGRRHGDHSQGSAALHGRQGRAGSQQKVIFKQNIQTVAPLPAQGAVLLCFLQDLSIK